MRDTPLSVSRRGFQESTGRLLARITNPLEERASAEVTLRRGGEIIAERNPVVEPGSESIILSGIDTPQGQLKIRETMSVRGPRSDVGGSPTIDVRDSSTATPGLPAVPVLGIIVAVILLGVVD